MSNHQIARRWFVTMRAGRDNEIRYAGKRIQWVVSPVQVALWTGMHTPEPRNLLQLAPMRRVSA